MKRAAIASEGTENATVMFECPGCGENHGVGVAPNLKAWGWNGSLESPTLTPSILVHLTKITQAGWAQYDAWKDGASEAPEKLDSITIICHSFVTDGRIQFLTDCTHFLAGQTVDIPEWK